MAAANSVEDFLPSANGFRFTNHFPPAPTVRINLGPLGRVGLGNASGGVCGGMAFAVRDYFQAGRPVPNLPDPPAQGTKLFDFITARLMDSFNGVDGVGTYIRWMWLPSADVRLIIGAQPGTFSRTVLDSWPKVSADIDANHPSPLGLVTVHTSDIRQVGKCHQVLAYGYRIDDDKQVTLSVYDPNTAHESADDVTISFSAADAHRVSPITHNINIAGSTLHGFFRSRYSPKRPPTSIG